MAALHFIYGGPGAGKTTLARRLAEEMPAVPFIEDEWLAALYDTITSLEMFAERSRRVRAIVAPLATRILRTGASVVLDFAGNTPRDRAWVRSIFDAAGAEHVLHILDVPDAECRRRVRQRNDDRPAGLYFGYVAEATVDAVLARIAPPSERERFNVKWHEPPTHS